MPSSLPATRRPGLLLALVAGSLGPAAAQEKDLAQLPKYLTPVPYADSRNDHVTQNLGPTGARGWIYGHQGDTHESREILVKSIEPGSPADGVLQPYDLILGAALPTADPASPAVLARFTADARLHFARAITWAESHAGQGQLRLLRQRADHTKEVTIQLPVLGDYSATSPFDCEKSAAIVEQAATFLVEHMPATGYAPGIGRPWNAALFLATEDPRHLDPARRSAMAMSIHHQVNDAGHETWRWGNTCAFLGEYYLATGDARVLPTLREYARVLAEGQCNPGTWGHKAVPDFIPPGYGSLNSSGVVCFLSLVLAKQCGIDLADEAIARSIDFYGSYAGRGSIPYGDHPPSYAATSNGKNGGAALAFHLLGAEPSAQWFARLCASSNLENFEGGHSGNYFNQTWSPLGAALAGRPNLIAFWKRFHSYRDLARRHDGSFITQPWPHTREGDLGTGNYVTRGPLWSTGSFALSYLADTRRLAILGRRDSVFAVDAPGELHTALALYQSKDFPAAARAAAALTKHEKPRVARLARQLESIAQRNQASLKLTLDEMRHHLESGDLFTLQAQLVAIESIIDPADPRLADMQAAIADPTHRPTLEHGALYDRAVRRIEWLGERGFERFDHPLSEPGQERAVLRRLAADPGQPLAAQAAAQLEAHPVLPQTHPLADFGAAGKPLDQAYTTTLEFDLSEPDALRGLALRFRMVKALRARLNGTRIVDFDLGRPNARSRTLPLKPVTRELLQPGTNHLELDLQPAGEGLEVSLLAQP